jgi:transcriptional regulator with XRE-family HTH domain
VHKKDGGIMYTLYENLLDLCKQRGITGAKMCTDIGVSKSLMTGLKMGRRTGMTAQTAQKIADYFGVSREYLVGKVNDIVLDNCGGCAENEFSILEKFLEILPDLSKKDLLKVNLKIAELLFKKN